MFPSLCLSLEERHRMMTYLKHIRESGIFSQNTGISGVRCCCPSSPSFVAECKAVRLNLPFFCGWSATNLLPSLLRLNDIFAQYLTTEIQLLFLGIVISLIMMPPNHSRQSHLCWTRLFQQDSCHPSFPLRVKAKGSRCWVKSVKMGQPPPLRERLLKYAVELK